MISNIVKNNIVKNFDIFPSLYKSYIIILIVHYILYLFKFLNT